MPLSKDNRISMSKKILIADEEIVANGMNQLSVNKRIESLQKEDDSNKALLGLRFDYIKSYEDEIVFLDGSPRTQLNESEYLKSVARLTGNYLFPANNNAPIPSIPTGVWTKFTPFYLSAGVGKGYNEEYNPKIADYEDLLIPQIISDISYFESFQEIKRVTGQKCTDGISPAPDTLSEDTDIHNALSSIKDKAQRLIAVLSLEKSVLIANPDTQNQSETQAAILNIDAIINSINTWFSYPDFNPLTTVFSCPIFNTYDVSTLAPTKGYSAQINEFKNAINSRSSQVLSRKSFILSQLGTVSQDLSTGYITLATGLYGERANVLNVRLNAMTGSLSRLNSSKNGENALQQEAQSIASNKNVLLNYLSVSKLSSVSNGTSFINLISSLGFYVGQKGYIVSDTQEEIEVVVQSITGNTLQLNKTIPPTYRPTDLARFYVDKT